MTHDVYSFGVVSPSTLYRIRGDFPAAEGYAEIESVHSMTGGEAANSSMVLARLGVSVKLDGNWLGDNDDGERTKALLSDSNIDVTRLPLVAGYEGVREVVFAAQETRTIFGTYMRLLQEGKWNMPEADDVRQASVVSVDPFFGAASEQAAAIGCAEGIPVVTVDCPHDSALLAHTGCVIVAESFIRENYPEQALDDLLLSYQRSTPGLVVFTFGDRAIRYGRAGQAAQTLQPFSIDAVDTTGGGDAFRAGVVYGFLRQWEDRRTIAFAAALAALVCTRFPGVMNAPGYDEVVQFMRVQES